MAIRHIICTNMTCPLNQPAPTTSRPSTAMRCKKVCAGQFCSPISPPMSPPSLPFIASIRNPYPMFISRNMHCPVICLNVATTFCTINFSLICLHVQYVFSMFVMILMPKVLHFIRAFICLFLPMSKHQIKVGSSPQNITCPKVHVLNMCFLATSSCAECINSLTAVSFGCLCAYRFWGGIGQAREGSKVPDVFGK